MQACSFRLEKSRQKTENLMYSLRNDAAYIARLESSIENSRILLNRLRQDQPVKAILAVEQRAEYHKELEKFKAKLKRKSRMIDAKATFTTEQFEVMDFKKGQLVLVHKDGTPASPQNPNSYRYPQRRYRYAAFRRVIATDYNAYFGSSLVQLGFFEKEFGNILSKNCDDIIDIIKDYSPFAEIKLIFAANAFETSLFPICIKFFFDIKKTLPQQLSMICASGPHCIRFQLSYFSDTDRDGVFFYFPNLTYSMRSKLRFLFALRKKSDFHVVFQVSKRAMIKV